MIKSRMQTDGFSPADGQKYKNTIDCVRTVWRTEGFGAFIRGLGPTLIRSVHWRHFHKRVLTVFFVGRHSRTAQRSSGSRWRTVSSTASSTSRATYHDLDTNLDAP